MAPLAAAANAMITKADAVEWLGLTTDVMNDFIQRSINNWSDKFEQAIGRTIKSAAHTDEVHDGGVIFLMPDNPPVTTLTSIKINDSTVTVTEYTINSSGSVIRKKDGKKWTGGPGSIELTYTGGYAEVPGDIQQIFLQIIALEFYLSGKSGRKALMKKGESFAGQSVSYERSPADQKRIFNEIVIAYKRRSR